MAEKAEVKDLFNRLDDDGSGELEVDELKVRMHACMHACFHACTARMYGSGELEVDELTAILKRSIRIHMHAHMRTHAHMHVHDLHICVHRSASRSCRMRRFRRQRM